MTNETIEERAERMVRQEVFYCVSALIYELAKGPDGEMCEAAQELFLAYDDEETDEDGNPEPREVFEHWIVSDWLADKLAERGETTTKDFWGLTIWARTTTGQGIAMDSIIEAIARDCLRPIA